MHEYYYYNKEQLLESPKIPLIVMEDNPTVFKALAEEMVAEIKRKNELGSLPSSFEIITYIFYLFCLCKIRSLPNFKHQL